MRRGWGALGAAAALALTAGCQQHPVQKEPGDPQFIVDQAMLRRDWPQNKAQWTNALLVGWPMRFPFDQDVTVDRPFPNSRTIDTALFVFQTFELPFTYIDQSPFERTIYDSGVRYDPTFTAMPGLPPPASAAAARQYRPNGQIELDGTSPGTSAQGSSGASGASGTPGTSGTTGGPANGPGTPGSSGNTGNPNAPGTVTPGAEQPGTPGTPGTPNPGIVPPGSVAPGRSKPGSAAPGGTTPGGVGTPGSPGAPGSPGNPAGTGVPGGGTPAGGTGSPGGTGTGSPGGTGTGSPGGTGTPAGGGAGGAGGGR